jgi:hypothetical protein
MSGQRWYRGRLAHLACFGVLLCACSARQRVSLAQGVPPSDSVVFAALIASLATDTSVIGPRHPLIVDPRPLLRDSTVTSVEARTLAPVSQAELEARRASIRELGIETGDALFPSNCPGRINLYDPADPAFATCPRTARLVTAIGLPRVGDSRRKEAASSSRFRTVRVIIASIAPNGISADIRDYVLEGTSEKWKVTRWIRLGFWE